MKKCLVAFLAIQMLSLVGCAEQKRPPKPKPATLIAAIEAYDNKQLEILLTQGLDPNVKTVGGETPLFEAVRNGEAEMIRTLVQHGASVNTSFFRRFLCHRQLRKSGPGPGQ